MLHNLKQSLGLTSLGQTIVLILALAIGSPTLAQHSEPADNWGNFRGPNFNGVSSTATPPTEWSADKNVGWKVEIPGAGSSSPVVWGDKVFVTTAVNQQPDVKKPARLTRQEIYNKFDTDGDGRLSDAERPAAQQFMRDRAKATLTNHQFIVLCFNRKTGEKVWEKVANEREPVDGHHADGNYAAASPVTDGKQLFVNFGSMGLFCYDLDGEEIWKRTDLGEMQTRGGFGEGSSITLTDELVILPWDHEGQSKIEALNRTTGETVWKTDREEPSAWATPVIATVDGKSHVIHAGDNFSCGYDLKSGEEIWRSSGLSMRPVATPVVYKNLGIFSASRQGATLHAYYLDRTGDISSDPAWKITKHSTDCSSLLLSENRLFYVSGNKGMLSCSNAEDGSPLFATQRLSGIRGIYSSPVAADGKVFVTGRGGTTVVLKDAETFETIATNSVGEPVDATIALAGKQIFIRGKNHLFCIQE